MINLTSLAQTSELSPVPPRMAGGRPLQSLIGSRTKGAAMPVGRSQTAFISPTIPYSILEITSSTATHLTALPRALHLLASYRLRFRVPHRLASLVDRCT